MLYLNASLFSRLAYFELVGQSWTQQQLIGGIRKHYTTQVTLIGYLFDGLCANCRMSSS